MPDSYFANVRRNPWMVGYWRQNDDASAIDGLDYGARYGLTGIYSSRGLGPALIQDDSGAASSVMTAGSMTVADAAPLRIIGDISIEAWIVPYAVSLTAGIVGKRNAANTFANPYALTLRNGLLSFELGNGSSSVILSGGVVPLMPTLVLATCFRGVIKLFVNGALVATGTLGAQAVADGGQSLIVGKFGTTPGVDLISEVALYNGSLSSLQAVRHFNLGQQILQDPAHYNLVDPPVLA